MKKVKIGFLSLVAITTFGFTVSEKINIPDNTKKVGAVPACFREVSVKNANCTGSTTDFIENVKLCPGETTGLLNKKLWGVTTGLTYVYTGSKPPACSVGTTYFCCATVVEDDSPCPDQPQFDLDGDHDFEYYKIVNTYCRP